MELEDYRFPATNIGLLKLPMEYEYADEYICSKIDSCFTGRIKYKTIDGKPSKTVYFEVKFTFIKDAVKIFGITLSKRKVLVEKKWFPDTNFYVVPVITETVITCN